MPVGGAPSVGGDVNAVLGWWQQHLEGLAAEVTDTAVALRHNAAAYESVDSVVRERLARLTTGRPAAFVR